jgi:hypothetical protein
MTSPFGLQPAPPDDGPPPMSWDDYTSRAVAELQAVIEANPDHERPLQEFLERHPPLVPTAFPDSSGHGAYLDVMITQPPLRALTCRTPDFMFIARHSGALTPVLVEIERPGKSWAIGTGQPHADLTQAVFQLQEWRRWFDQSGNKQVFFDQYAIPSEWRRRDFAPVFVLVYGRSDIQDAAANRVRQDIRRQGFTTYSWDNVVQLAGNFWQRSYLTVRAVGVGEFEARQLPACASLSATYPYFYQRVRGRLQAVERAGWISDERRAYLTTLVPQLEKWAATEAPRLDR